MKIVHIVRQFWPSRGGLEEFVYRLALEQSRAGAEVRVVTLDRLFTDADAALRATDFIDGIEIRRVSYVGSKRYPIAPGAFAHVGDADVVHVHAVDFFFDFVALASLFWRRPIVATTHGGFFHTSAHAALKRLWFGTITRLTAGRYRAIVACSESDHRLFATISPDNLRLIENGVDIEKFAEAASRMPRKSLVTIGRFSVNKRLDRLLDAMHALIAQDAQWRLDIIGFESDWGTVRLREEIARRSLQAHVEVHTGLETGAVAQLIGRSSLFVSASEYEGFGIALIEALSAGLSPVVHANDAYSAFAARRGSIHITDFEDPIGSARAIRRVYEELEAAPSLREASVAAAKEFAWPRVADAYFEIYRHAIDSTRRRYWSRDVERKPTVSNPSARLSSK